MYSSLSDMLTLPTATPRHSTFFSWNLMLDLISFTCTLRCEGDLPPALGRLKWGLAFNIMQAKTAGLLTVSFTGTWHSMDQGHLQLSS